MIKRWGNKKSLPLFVFFAIHETVSYFCIYKPSNPDYQLWSNINLKFVPTLWRVALPAQAGGANRVELCAGIPEGGTTPSYGDIVIAREALTKTLLHVIIRPRGGDFLYSPIEQRIMLKDIDNARRLGSRRSCIRLSYR